MRSSLLLHLFVMGVAAPSCERRSAPRPKTTADTRVAAPAPSVSATPGVTAAATAPAARLEARVHLPARSEAGQKAPLLLMLHSIGTSAEDIEGRTDWPRFASEQGIAWMAPNGPLDAQGRRFWDAGPSCCNFTGHRVDHVAALGELLQRTLRERPELDADRVYVGGISNGGFMAHRFACESPDLVRGVVSISGAGPLERVACREARHLRVLEVHGDADPIVRYGGGHFLGLSLLPEHASASQTFTDWATRLGCEGDVRSGEPLDFEARYPGKETRVSRYARCARGAVELWTVSGGDHYLGFRAPSPQRIWQFLSQ